MDIDLTMIDSATHAMGRVYCRGRDLGTEAAYSASVRQANAWLAEVAGPAIAGVVESENLRILAVRPPQLDALGTVTCRGVHFDIDVPYRTVVMFDHRSAEGAAFRLLGEAAPFPMWRKGRSGAAAPAPAPAPTRASREARVGNVVVSVSGPAATLWQKGGRTRVYVASDRRNYVDVIAWASSLTFPTLAGFEATPVASGIIYRGSDARTRGTEIRVEKEGSR